MPDFYAKAQQQNVTRNADGNQVQVRALRDGALIVVPWYQALVMEGRVFQAIGPSPLDATGLTLVALASYADTVSSIFADIPDGTAFLPLEIHGSFLATGGAVSHQIGFISDTLNGTGGTETAVTPLNLRRDSPVSSGATAAHTASGETDKVTGAEVILFHRSAGIDIDSVSVEPSVSWSAVRAGVTPIGLDAGSINFTMTVTTSSTGFVQIAWAELSESVFV